MKRMEVAVKMNNQSKKMVMDALFKVINSAPALYSQRNYLYPQTYQTNDVSTQEFNTWVNYVNQILDISYDYVGLNIIMSTKMMISQLVSQYGVSNIQRIDQIKQELIKLTQAILQY